MTPRYTLSLKRYAAGAVDAHGNVSEGFSAPEPFPVYGWAVVKSVEVVDGRDEITTRTHVFAPPSSVCGPRDRLTINGEDWSVKGDVEDYTKGPWGYTPGSVIAVERVEG